MAADANADYRTGNSYDMTINDNDITSSYYANNVPKEKPTCYRVAPKVIDCIRHLTEERTLVFFRHNVLDGALRHFLTGLRMGTSTNKKQGSIVLTTRNYVHFVNLGRRCYRMSFPMFPCFVLLVHQTSQSDEPAFQQVVSNFHQCPIRSLCR